MTPFEYFSIMDNYLCLYELAVIHKMKYIQHQKKNDGTVFADRDWWWKGRNAASHLFDSGFQGTL